MKNRNSNHKEVMVHTLRLADSLTQLKCSKFCKDRNNENFCWLLGKKSKFAKLHCKMLKLYLEKQELYLPRSFSQW